MPLVFRSLQLKGCEFLAMPFKQVGFWECLSLVASMDGSAFGKHLIVSAEFGNFKPPEEHFLALHTVFCLYNCLTLYLRLPNKAQIKNL